MIKPASMPALTKIIDGLSEAIIIVGGGILPVPMIKEAFALGYETLVIDGDPDAPAQAEVAGAWPMFCGGGQQ